MFGLSLYEFITVVGLIAGAVFWCGAMYQRMCDIVKGFEKLTGSHEQLENRVDHIENHLGIPKPPIGKPPF